MSERYMTVVGLEIHVELSTVSKMFSSAPNDPFHAAPNTNLTPICIGMPGTLPVPNREAIRRTLLLGLALGSKIPQESKFDRKHYFYPDLPKGYQISQYDQPFCEGGSLEVAGQTVTFTRVHLEEDAGKLLHAAGTLTQVDLNRAGVALVEIVTEPDIRSGEQARLFLQELRLLVRALGIADAEMEKGQLRCDANVSVRFEEDGQTMNSYISEVKNLNSFRMVERAIIYEAERLYTEWHEDAKARAQKHKITVGWDDAKGETKLQRKKEGAADYRYFPEPDVPAFRIYDADHNDPRPEGVEAFDLAELRQELPLVPSQKRAAYLTAGVKPADADVVVTDETRDSILSSLLAQGVKPESLALVASFLVNDESATKVTPAQLLAIAELRLTGEINSNIPTQAFALLADKPDQDVVALIDEQSWRQNNDDTAIRQAVEVVVRENAPTVADYKAGKQQVIGFLIGQVRRQVPTANPEMIKQLLNDALS